jgi:hypothetical protein
MFNFSEWLVNGIVDGYKKGEITFSGVTKFTAIYLSNGFITKEQAEEIRNACPCPIIEEEIYEQQ